MLACPRIQVMLLYLASLILRCSYNKNHLNSVEEWASKSQNELYALVSKASGYQCLGTYLGRNRQLLGILSAFSPDVNNTASERS